MELKEFDYNLPEELIAQVPIKNRDESRLLVLDRKKQKMEDKIFRDIIDYLEPGDCIVRNNTKLNVFVEFHSLTGYRNKYSKSIA